MAARAGVRVIYDRPPGVHRPVSRVVAGVLLVAMLVLGFLAYPPRITATTVEWRDPVGLPALDGNEGAGRAAPLPLQVELDGSYPVSVSVAPTLVWRDVPGGVGQVRFVVTTLAEKSPRVLWDRTVAVGADRVARATVPAGVLGQGRTYLWSAQSATGGQRSGPHAVTVDVQRSGTQPVFSAGDLAVTEGTGELVYTYSGPQLSTLAGPLNWTLIHRPTNTPQKGLPDGWRMVVSGSTGWDALRLNDDGSVTLGTGTGVSVTYVKRGENQWQPQVGRYNAAGETTLLAENADGTFTATDGNRAVTVFSKPTRNLAGAPVRVWALDTPAPQQTWVDGALRSITDPVTSNPIAFLYGGDEGCATETDPGFVQAPKGLFCGVIDWAGNIILVQYVETDAGLQIGRIASGIGMGIFAQSTDIGWDRSGRIVEARTPLAATTVASGAVGGLGTQDTRVMTQIAYDAQGRVASLTAPAGLISGKVQPEWREQRARTSFSYAPFTVDMRGEDSRTGFTKRDWLDPITLQVVKTMDESGNVTTTTYDGNGSPTRVEDQSSGTVTVTRYNRYGKPVEQIGPTKGSLSSPTAPRTTTAYDQDVQGRDWKGLAVRYWDNAGFNGAPAGGSTGPIVSGAMAASLAFNWSSSPTGGSGPWAARLSGVYEAAKAGQYAFESGTAARLWVNGNLCAPACIASLDALGTAGVQVDVVAPNGGMAGVRILATAPDGTQQPLPTERLRPNYGLTTSTTVREQLGDGTTRDLVSRSVYDPVTTQLLQTISPSGATITRTYEPYDPSKGQWGRSTSVTDASGKTTTSSFYAAGESAPDCSGTPVPQDGELKSTTMPDGQVVSQTGVPSAGPIASGDGASVVCGTALEANVAFATTTSGAGPTVEQYSFPTIAGDPLATGTVTRTGADLHTEFSRLDTNGRPWQSVDAHGTTTLRRWDPLSGQLTRIVETTAKGEARTTEYTYDPSGQVATIAVNGHRLITNAYTANGTLLRATLANGAVQTFELDANNNGRRTTTTFPDGTTLTETQVHSPSGRLLSRTVAGPTGTSTYQYDYNADGRLIDTKLTGTIPVREQRWQNAYEGADGRNGNRAAETTTLADGSTVTARFAYGADNRLLTAERERIPGAIEYDAAGRATKVGAVALSYDAAGHLLSAADGDRTYSFTDAGTTTTLTRTVDGAQRTVTATSSGETLILGADRRIDAQVVSPARGLQVVLGADGKPTRWIYEDALGNGTWTSRGAAVPRQTHLYSPDGEAVSVARSSDPATAVDLVLDGLGWMSGSGASTLRLSTPITIMGARSYTPDGGRWLQPDPTVGGSMNAYEYAIGDPINQVDPTGHASWGWLWGGLAAMVVGTAIGALTFGIGVGGALGYGYAAWWSQVALGAVGGAISSMAGEVVTQRVNGAAWGDLNWASIGVAAGIGAGLGAATAGLSGWGFKVKAPGKQIRLLGANTPQEAQSITRMGAYNNVWKKHTDAVKALGDDVKPGVRLQNMFTKQSWRAKRVAAARAEAQQLRPSGEIEDAVFEVLRPTGLKAGVGNGADPAFFRASAGQSQNVARSVAAQSQQFQSQQIVSQTLSQADDSLANSVRQLSANQQRVQSVYSNAAKSQKNSIALTNKTSVDYFGQKQSSNLSVDYQQEFQDYMEQVILKTVFK